MRILLINAFIFILSTISLNSIAEKDSKDCFKNGSQWHDIVLPDGMNNVRWLFGDDKHHTPFMSVTFNIEESAFQSWARKCSVNLRKFSDSYQWEKDIENGTGGFIVVAKYIKSNRYCISVERTSQPEAEMSVNGRSYYGCPLNREIDY